MIFNVSQILKSPVGTSRQYEWEGTYEALNKELDLVGPVSGSVRMDRTNWGILCTARMTSRILLQCGRCLDSFSQDLPIQLCEEFFPTIDLKTGLQTTGSSDIHDFKIDNSHVLDLTDAFRQYGMLARPSQPVCQTDCRGLCSTCGANLNYDDCDCVIDRVDPRLATLRSWFSASGE